MIDRPTQLAEKKDPEVGSDERESIVDEGGDEETDYDEIGRRSEKKNLWKWREE